jgi:hypothetical protein
LTILGFLCAIVGPGAGKLHAQAAAVKGKIDAVSEDGFVTLKGVKVIVRDNPKGHDKPKTVRVTKTVDDGQYEIEIRGGPYEIFACDRHLEYEPYVREVDLKEGGIPKKVNFRLRKQPMETTLRDDKGNLLGANVTGCLQHLETGCEARFTTDSHGKVTIPGIPEHFGVREGDALTCD